MKIKFSAVKDCELVFETWEGDEAEAVAKGAEAIGAKVVRDDVYSYFAEETDSSWEVTTEEMSRLGAALLSGYDFSEAYCIWCAGNGVEVES